MKVLICIPCLLTGGTEIQTLNLVRALVEGGHEVMVACYFEHSDYMVRQYNDAGAQVVLFSEDGCRISGWKGLWFLWSNLRNLIHGWKPDIAHVQYMAPGAQPIILLRLLGIRNIISTAHTVADIYSSTGLRIVRFIQKHFVRVWTCITERAERSFFGTSEVFSEHTIIGRHAHYTIYNSLPFGMKFCENRTKRAVRTIGVVSRLETIKGMDLVVPAFAEVLKKYPDARLIIVGDGYLKKSMFQRAQELNINNAITWAGRQQQNELHKWYEQMDIVLMPSRSEGFGLTAIEAMANGCVVVASNVGGLPEVVKNGEVGLLHASENITDLAEKIMTLMEDTSMFNGMKDKVQKYAQRFDFKSFSRSFNTLYIKL